MLTDFGLPTVEDPADVGGVLVGLFDGGGAGFPVGDVEDELGAASGIDAADVVVEVEHFFDAPAELFGLGEGEVFYRPAGEVTRDEAVEGLGNRGLGLGTDGVEDREADGGEDAEDGEG